MRAQGADTPKKHFVGVANNERRKASVSLSMHNNSMHDNAVDEDEEQFDFFWFDNKIFISKKERINIVKYWLKDLPAPNSTEVNVMNIDACYQ